MRTTPRLGDALGEYSVRYRRKRTLFHLMEESLKAILSGMEEAPEKEF